MRHDPPSVPRRQRAAGLGRRLAARAAVGMPRLGPRPATSCRQRSARSSRSRASRRRSASKSTAAGSRARRRCWPTNGLDAIVVGPGSSLRYFTGAEWGLSERFFGFVLGRRGDPVWVVPAFERDRGLEQIRIGGDVRAWQEDESPHALVARVARRSRRQRPRRARGDDAVRVLRRDRPGRAGRALRERDSGLGGMPDGEGRARARADAPRRRDHAARAPRGLRVADGGPHRGRGGGLERGRASSARRPRRLARAVRPRRGLPARHREAAAAAARGTWC